MDNYDIECFVKNSINDLEKIIDQLDHSDHISYNDQYESLKLTEVLKDKIHEYGKSIKQLKTYD